jgi:hypothetical protein
MNNGTGKEQQQRGEHLAATVARDRGTISEILDEFELDELRDELYNDFPSEAEEDLDRWFDKQARYVAGLVFAGALADESAVASLRDRLGRYTG